MWNARGELDAETSTFDAISDLSFLSLTASARKLRCSSEARTAPIGL